MSLLSSILLDNCCKLTWGSINAPELLAGAVLSVLLSLLIIWLLRPSVIIKPPIFTNLEIADRLEVIKIPVINKSWFFSANNFVVEAAYVFQDLETCHLKLDLEHFLIIPNKIKGDNTRDFKAYDINDVTKAHYPDSCGDFTVIINNLKACDGHLRVRVHATHEFTGFGRAFEKRFIYNTCTRSFVRHK